jgi:hypothetical protein
LALATFNWNIYRKNIRRQIVFTTSIDFPQKIWGLTKDLFRHSGVINTAVTEMGDFVDDFLREFEDIFKKAARKSNPCFVILKFHTS